MDTLDITFTSPLVVADRLISLAQALDRVGYLQCAGQLLMVAFEVLDDAADTLQSAACQPAMPNEEPHILDYAHCEIDHGSRSIACGPAVPITVSRTHTRGSSLGYDSRDFRQQ